MGGSYSVSTCAKYCKHINVISCLLADTLFPKLYNDKECFLGGRNAVIDSLAPPSLLPPLLQSYIRKQIQAIDGDTSLDETERTRRKQV